MPLYIQVILCLLLLIGVDVLIGVVKALTAGTLQLNKLPSFLETAIPTNQLIAFTIAVLTDAVQPNGTLSATAMSVTVVSAGGALALKLVGDIVSKLTPAKA